MADPWHKTLVQASAQWPQNDLGNQTETIPGDEWYSSLSLL